MIFLKRVLAVYEDSGGRTNSSWGKSVLAEGTGPIRRQSRGRRVLIGEAIAQIERPGWEERQYYAEALRVKSWLLSRKGDPGDAERSYIASLDWAWELRTATSCARLMRDKGRVSEANELLAPVYAWFAEGFATKDLKDVKALLDELEATGAAAPVARA
jgi:hypothetical protein